MRIFFFVLASVLLINLTVKAQETLLTIAESSNYIKTSTHQNVLDFIENLDQDSQYLRIETIGKTTEGKPIPMLVLANPMVASPESLQNDDRLIIRFIPEFHEEKFITIKGEVQFPGYYSIEETETTLLEILEKCGGPTSNADLQNAFLQKHIRL